MNGGFGDFGFGSESECIDWVNAYTSGQSNNSSERKCDIQLAVDQYLKLPKDDPVEVGCAETKIGNTPQSPNELQNCELAQVAYAMNESGENFDEHRDQNLYEQCRACNWFSDSSNNDITICDMLKPLEEDSDVSTEDDVQESTDNTQ